MMRKGAFLYAGSLQELLNEAKGHIWICRVTDEKQARELEKRYHVSSRQYIDGELQLRLINTRKPDIDCTPVSATLEDAYIYINGRSVWCAVTGYDAKIICFCNMSRISNTYGKGAS
ncbi:MAG: hypothetical protein Q4C91_01500 [Eubacteriales bacterium]|nr:hypothetical protein [Eubacteriales bacterium]